MKTQVLIVGAGPTGIMMAALLGRKNISCRLIDASEGPAKESRAIGIHAKTLELFHNLGLVQEFLKRGQRAAGAKIFLNGKERMSLDFSDMGRKDTPYPYLFLLGQSETEEILIEDLSKHGIGIERNTKLFDFKQYSNKVQAEIVKPDGKHEIVSCDYIIGADGGHSKVREILGLSFEGATYPDEYIMTDAKVNWELEHDKLMFFMSPGHIGVHLPLRGRDHGRILTVRDFDTDHIPRTLATTTMPATLCEVEKQFKIAAKVPVQLTDPSWIARFHVHHRCVNKMRQGRAFLAGDAAHIHSPAGAQGMNTGLQDAANLAWKLAMVLNHEAKESILDTYESERLPIARKVLAFTDRFFSLATSRNRAFVTLRNILIPTVAKLMMGQMAGRRALFHFVSQLGIHYHPSSVVSGKTGHRMPNFNSEFGERLFDIIQGYEWHLLIFNGTFVPELEGANLHFFKDSKFKKEGFILVRPDGHVAYESDKSDEVSFEKLKTSLPELFIETYPTDERAFHHHPQVQVDTRIH